MGIRIVHALQMLIAIEAFLYRKTGDSVQLSEQINGHLPPWDNKAHKLRYSLYPRAQLNKINPVELKAALTNYGNPGLFLQKKLSKTANWKWVKIPLTESYDFRFGLNTLKITSINGEIDLDKFVITTKGDSQPSY